MNNLMHSRIESLKALLASAAIKVPVYICFHTLTERYMLGVQSVEVHNELLKVQSANRETQILCLLIEELVEIRAYKDSNGMPIFLHDFDAEEETIPEIRRRVDFERFNLAERASEEYRQVQEWMYDFVHFKKSGSVSTELLSAVDRYGSESLSYGDASEVIGALHMAA
jgi:hypothetical protein